ncbi:ATP-binding protein [Pseudomonadota bacterium]
MSWESIHNLTGPCLTACDRVCTVPKFRHLTAILNAVYRLKSILGLILAGFALAAAPLVMALINGVSYVEDMADHSQQAVRQVVRMTQTSRMLVEQLTAMERNARQYQVVGNQALYDVYESTHRQFQQTQARLRELQPNPAQQHRLETLAGREQHLFQQIETYRPGSEEGRQAVLEFVALSNLAQEILAASNDLVDQEEVLMEARAEKAKQDLLLNVMGLGPAALFLALIFAMLIAKPIRQLAQAIRQLGDGQFTVPIAVSGPKDLASLGERLDWLRLRLVALEQEKSKFLRRVSHDLKTPLTAIREGSELLAGEVVGPLNPDQEEVATIMRNNGIRLQRLIDDLLNFNLASSRQGLHQVQQVAVERLVETVLADHGPAIKSKHINLETDLVPVSLTGDKQKLATVIDNLILNAVNYCPPQGRINVGLQQLADKVMFNVIDSGQGFNESDKVRVFEAFYQGRESSHGHVKGTGLGLSIAQEYVHTHKGTIEVIDGETEGGHVRVTLPVDKVEHDAKDT